MTDELKMNIEKQSGLIVAKFSGNTLKRISFNRFEGHAIRWHDPYRAPDREGNPFDLAGEWFSSKTNRMLKMGYPIVGAPVNYQHGMHKDFGATGIGLLDFTEEDEIGQFVKGELYTHEQYIDMLKDLGRMKGYQVSEAQYSKRADMAHKAVMTLVNEVPLQFSGGFDPSTWIVDPETKHIDQSGLIHAAFTPTPADDLNPIITFKSMFREAFQLEHERKTFDMSIPASPAREVTEPIEQEAENSYNVGSLTVDANGRTISKSTLNKGLTKMDAMAFLNQLATMLQEFLSGAGEEPEAAIAIADEVVDELKADVEKLPEEEKGKALDEELVKAWMGKAVAKAEAKLAKKQNLNNVAKSEANKALDAWKAKQPVSEETAKGSPKYTGGNKGSSITVSESRKYQHLTAQEMALAAKIMQSAARGGKANKRVDGETLIEDGLASEDFIRTMAGKVSAELKRYNGSDRTDSLSQQDYSALKSIKADELNSSSIAAQGGDWVSIYYDPAAWERAREVTDLFNLLTSRGMVVRDIPQGAESVEFKIDLSSPTVYTRNQARSTDSTGRPEVTARITPIGTDKVNVTPAEHVLATSNTDILNEDSIINMVNYLNTDIQRTLAEALEDSLINGDIETAANTNINLIDGTPGTGLSKPLYLAYDGFRKHALVTHSGQANDVNSALSIDDFFDTIAEYDDNAIESRTEELLYIVDKDTHRAARKLPELLTPGVAMEGATIYVGKMPDIDGVPIYRSGFLAKSNTAGKISATPGNNIYGQILSVYPYYWGYARKRAITIETDRDIMAGVTVFVASMRHALLARSAKASTISYRITV